MKIGSFIVGFLAGGALCGAAAWHFARDTYLQQADEEIASIKKYYKGEFEKAKTALEEANKGSEESKKAMNTYRDALVRLGSEIRAQEEASGKEPEGSKSDISEEETEEDDEDDEDFPSEDAYHEIKEPLDTRKREPYPIFEEQFAEEMCEFFDKITLEYYPEDDILLTEDGELIDNREKIVGDSWMDDLSEGFDDAFVRNEMTGCDYMIIAKSGRGVDNMKGVLDDE